MTLIKNKKTLFLACAGLVFLAASALILTCKSPTSSSGSPENGSYPSETRLVVEIHDTPFKKDGINVEKILLTVIEMVIIDENGNHIVILDEERSMDILAVSQSEPVILSDVAVDPGTYEELRLVLHDDCTIQADGELHHIKIPSGEESGLKLKGPFNIPAGKLFRLTIDFAAEESVIYNHGEGFALKPVLNISNASEVDGIFRGNLTASGSLGDCETLLELRADGTARMRVASYPKYTLNADYAYNSSRKEVVMTNVELSAPGLKKRALKRVMKKLPDTITLPIKQWSLNNLIAVDITGLTCNLYRVDEFDFSEGVTFTDFTLNIDYPDDSKIGKDVIAEIRFIDTGMPPIVEVYTFEGSRITDTIKVPNNSIQGSSTRLLITSYLFENEDDYNVDMGVYSSIITPLMTDSFFSETTENPWQKADILTIIRDAENQEYTVKFPPSLNIKMDHGNFTNNNPVISWDHYPEAVDGYFTVVLVKDKNRSSIDSDRVFAVAYYAYTTESRVTVDSSMVTFTPTSIPSVSEENPPSIAPGDMIRIEVFVLDGTGTLNTQSKKGAILMDTKTIIR